MLEDRDYMRATSRYGASRWQSATAILLITNAVIFLGQEIIRNAAPRFPLDSYLGLSCAGLAHGYVWQLLSFQFLHGNLIHLLLNSIGLFSFGFAVEQFLGRRRFVALYLTSGVIGGLTHVLGSLLWPSHFAVLTDSIGKYYVPVVGASAGLFGLIAAFATMFPERDLTVYIFFVLPVTVSARVLLGVCIGISVLGVLFDKSNVAHGAHAGGILGGWLMLRYFARRTIREPRVSEEKPPKQAVRSDTDFVSTDVDPILEKISRQGIHSLTAAERRVLDEARRKMEKR